MPDDGLRSGMLQGQWECGFRGIVCDGEDKVKVKVKVEVEVEVKVKAEVEEGSRK